MLYADMPLMPLLPLLRRQLMILFADMPHVSITRRHYRVRADDAALQRMLAAMRRSDARYASAAGDVSLPRAAPRRYAPWCSATARRAEAGCAGAQRYARARVSAMFYAAAPSFSLICRHFRRRCHVYAPPLRWRRALLRLRFDMPLRRFHFTLLLPRAEVIAPCCAIPLHHFRH